MCILIKILVLLWLINLTPPLIAFMWDDKWNFPLDGNRLFSDGKPLLGSHKTLRGLAGGIITGTLLGGLLGFPLWIGFLCGTLSMTGDLLTSFVKRRFNKPSGSLVPGFDQIPEGALPFIVLAPYFALTGRHILIMVILFSIGAFAGSWFLDMILLKPPHENYSRTISTRSRFREWRSCQSIRHPLHLILNFDRTIYYHIMMETAFHVLGLYEIGKQNALDVRQKNLTLCFEDLPEHFNNYRILFMSDLHLDGLDGLTEKLQEMVCALPVDLCLLGGDYRTEEYGSFSRTLLRLNRLVRKINARDGIYAVLGNHDCIEMIEPLQKRGIRFLVNDAVAIDKDRDKLWIAGVDDPYYYQAHDLQQTFEEIPQEAFTILVSHAPRIYREAAQYSPRLYLCGHTHAGQVQLPCIGPLFTHSKAPRRFSMGLWKYEGMQGYTSAGAGVSGAPVRFGCRGEIVLITLKKAS